MKYLKSYNKIHEEIKWWEEGDVFNIENVEDVDDIEFEYEEEEPDSPEYIEMLYKKGIITSGEYFQWQMDHGHY